MHYLFLISLFIIVQNVTVVRTEHYLKRMHGPKFKIAPVHNTPENNLAVKDDCDEVDVPAENQDTEARNMNSPFKQFKPTGKNHDDSSKDTTIENFYDEPTSKPSGIKKFNATETLKKWKNKFYEHRFTLSPTVVIIIIFSTLIVTCCCTIWLRHQIIDCFQSCCPSKKKQGYDQLDSESGKQDKSSKFKKFREKYEQLSSFRAKSLSKDYTPVEIINNIEKIDPSPLQPQENIETASSTTGCCGGGLCKSSKKKHGRNK